MVNIVQVLVLGTNVDVTSYVYAVQQIKAWQKKKENKCVCAANVHMLMEAWNNPDFQAVVNSANIVTPDGMPLVWMLRLKGYKDQQRVYGPTLMLHVVKMAATENIPVGFYGGKPEVLNKLVNRMQAKFPKLNLAYMFSPPFRTLSPDEDEAICNDIRKSGLRILFVGLGCPKQERWMFEHRDRISAVMLGVGAAFDFHAGAITQAPSWMQKMGLEWAYRFSKEPRRLWKRYLVHNPRFAVLAIADLLGVLKK